MFQATLQPIPLSIAVADRIAVGVSVAMIDVVIISREACRD
jgi:hypothetical protein